MRPAILLLLVPLASSAQDKPIPGTEPIKIVKIDRKEPVAYENDVEPIFVKKCSFCHSGNVKEARLDLGSYEGLMKGGKRGKSIVPGNADGSLLYQVSGKMRRPMMPPKSETPLTPEEYALIKL